MVKATRERSVDFGNVIWARFEVTSCNVSSRSRLQILRVIRRAVVIVVDAEVAYIRSALLHRIYISPSHSYAPFSYDAFSLS